jgi:hypothetical protein
LLGVVDPYLCELIQRYQQAVTIYLAPRIRLLHVKLMLLRLTCVLMSRHQCRCQCQLLR